MRINNNIMALNAHRQLGVNQTNSSKSMERLSSGMRINRAGDDAAGLAISEKMRGQIRGLKQAQRNAQDGISLIQTAEGALNETHAILQRMRELATQSATDTNTEADRVEIQKEIDQLAQEITRIANNTEFNTQTLVNGGIKEDGLGINRFHIGANKGQDIELSINAMDAKSLGVSRDVLEATVSNEVIVSGVEVDWYNAGTALTDGASLALTADATAAKTEWASIGGTGSLTFSSTANSSQYNDYSIVLAQGSVTGVEAAIDHDAKTITLTGADLAQGTWTKAAINAALAGEGIAIEVSGDAAGAVVATAASGEAATTAGLADDEVKLTFNGEDLIVKSDATSATFTSAANKGLTFKFDGTTLDGSVAATVAVSTDAATAATFANGETTEAVAKGGIDVSSQTAASEAIETIDVAIGKVSAERSMLGAV
jgi:flagellin